MEEKEPAVIVASKNEADTADASQEGATAA
jgi:hypothetical protein